MQISSHLAAVFGQRFAAGQDCIDLVRILLGAELQKQSLVDALQCRHDGLLGGILGLRCGLKIVMSVCLEV